MLAYNHPYIISIAAVSGGGKTAISKELHQLLQQSKVIYFDDYQLEGPEDIIDWVDRGANYEEWDITPLIQDIEKLATESLHYIILDYPFARMHSKLRSSIDLAVFIDTPLDIALARRIIRDYQQDSKVELFKEMDLYVNYGRKGYLEMLTSIKPNSDLVVDGTLTVQDILINITEAMKVNQRDLEEK